MGAIARGDGDRRPLARSSVNQAICAVVLAHRTAGHALDRKHPVVSETWRGISCKKARTETLRQAPLTADDLRPMLAKIGRAASKLPADALTPRCWRWGLPPRCAAADAALLALGWAAALHRSELDGLAWEKVGDGTGALQLDDRGLVVTLKTSKGSQTEAARVVVPCPEMPTACASVKLWASVAALQPGEPMFRAIDKGQHIGRERLTGRSVSRIIKARVRAQAIASGKSEDEAEAIAEHMSGHSMRAGYATAAAAQNMPGYRNQQHTRHKSAEMVARYIREADKWTKSGLKGVGF